MTSTLGDASSTNDNGYSFTINFANPCDPFTAPSNPAAYTYKIGTGPYSFTIPAYTKNAACTYSESLSISPSTHSWLTLSGRTVQVLTGDKSLDATDVTFTVTSTLTSDPFSGSNNQYTF